MTAHSHAESASSAVLDEPCACLTDDFDFERSTIQLESVDRQRLEQGGHPQVPAANT